MDTIKLLPKPRSWRAGLFALYTLLGIALIVLSTWYLLDQQQKRDSQHRFELDVQAIGQLVQARMQAYEMVLRGAASAFAGTEAKVTLTQWDKVMEQLRAQELYPGISSIVWSRHLHHDELAGFMARTQADGSPDFQIFPEGIRDDYQIVKYINPLNERTERVIGLDILTQFPQNLAIIQTIDSGQATLSMPLPDMYAISPEPESDSRVGVFMYFPVYQSGQPPPTRKQRRATILGLTNAAFRGQELAQGIFGTQLRLFQINAHDIETDQLLFDTQYVQTLEAPPDWQAKFHAHLDVPLYGRIWRLEVTGTPEYEQGLISRNHDLVLLIGLCTAVLGGLLSGGFVWQRDRQMHSEQQVSMRLREQAEQLMLANRYKTEFLANMSHELRTPLNSILILSDQLRQNVAGNLNEKQTRHASIIHRAGNDLLQLINDVLDLAKIEAGRMQINLEPLNLQDILVDMDAAMRPLAEAKGLHLHIRPISADSDLPQRVYTDRVRLHQILRNLLSNAIKFTDQGDVYLEVHLEGILPDGRSMLGFAVRDTGIGIDPVHHAQAFEAFAQLDGSTRRRFGGTGLGLPITRQLAQALEGDIDLVSAPDKGSIFTVHLPMQSAVPLSQIKPATPQRGGAGPTLLIVEDDPIFAATIIEQAHTHGFSSVHCVSGLQALEILRNEAFIAIILDIMLPDISGWQLFRRLRAQPGHQHTPVHIISSLPQPGGLGTDHGTRYLTKPIDQDVLEQVFSSLQHTPDPSRKMPLLLVEDVETEREHYQQQLAALGFSITAVSNAAQARAAWSNGVFDVLVVDLNLPDENGFNLLDSLDRLRSLRNTRVVVNTGIDVNHQGLQRLHGYSAVVVHKQGSDNDTLGQAVQGFLGQVTLSTNTGTGIPPSSFPTATTHSTLHGHHLLLVDDDVRNVYAMTAVLDGFGLHIHTAGNGEEAIACFQREPLDVILMDISMPVMDGYTATRLLKTEHGCRIPIIALTAHAMQGDREKCLAAGADDYMAKPINGEALRALLERWLLSPKGT